MTTSKSDIDVGFYKAAKRQLQRLRISASQLLKDNPRRSKKEIAAMVGGGVTSRGLTVVLFEESRNQSTVRSLAKDLLYRKILEEFPDGWEYDDKVHTSVKLGSWHFDIHEFAPEFEDFAAAIVRSLTSSNAPKVGWKPDNRDDERITVVFDKCWP
jgi:hypothetical protein